MRSFARDSRELSVKRSVGYLGSWNDDPIIWKSLDRGSLSTALAASWCYKSLQARQKLCMSCELSSLIISEIFCNRLFLFCKFFEKILNFVIFLLHINFGRYSETAPKANVVEGQFFFSFVENFVIYDSDWVSFLLEMNFIKGCYWK